MNAKIPVIDTHAHLIDTREPGYAAVAHKWGDSKWGGGVDDLIVQMDRAGVDYACLLTSTIIDVMEHFHPDVREDILISFDPFINKACYWRDWAAHKDRFYLFADSIDPRVPGYVERADRDLENGATGLKLLPGFTGTTVDEECWDPIFQLLDETRKPCVIDLSYWYLEVPWFAPRLIGKYPTFEDFAETVHSAADKFPDVRMEITHYGTPILLESLYGDHGGHESVSGEREIDFDALLAPIEMIKPHPNLFCGLSAYQHLIGEDEEYPYPTALRIIEILASGLGADRLIFGTDWPYLGRVGYPELIRSIREAPFLSRDESDEILGGTAWRFLWGDKADQREPPPYERGLATTG